MRVIGIIFSIFIVCIYFINLKWGWEVTNWSQTMGISKDENGKVTVEPMPENPLLGLLEQVKPDPAAFGTQQSAATTQSISVSRMIKLDDVLADGEQPPDPALEAVYVEARAPQILSHLCEDVVRTLGTKCRVLEISSTSRKDSYFRIKGDLTYLPETPVEQSPNTRDLLFKAIRVRTQLAPLNRTQKVQDTPSERQMYLKKADSICAEVRKTFGNCTLSDVHLESRIETSRGDKQNFSNQRPSLRVSMQVTVLDHLREDREKVKAFIEKLASRPN